MSKLNPANTIYGQAAQILKSTWSEYLILDGAHESAEDLDNAIACAVSTLNDRHMELLAEQAATPSDADMIEAAARALYDGRYNAVTWESSMFQPMYRNDARAALQASGCLKGDK